MEEFLDIPTLFFIVIAIVIFWRLRSVLGTRTGTERPPFNPYERRDGDKADGKPETDDKVVAMPRRQNGVEPPRHDAETRALKLESEIERVAQGNESVAEGLKAIAETDSSFMPRAFMDGALGAYEMIVTAFANSDRKTLKTLLDKDVYDSFESEISAREGRDEKVDFTFVGFNDVKMTEAGMDKRNAVITVVFNAQVVSATRNATGDIVDGDAEAVVDIADEWTFARSTRSRDPNWKLIATNQLS